MPGNASPPIQAEVPSSSKITGKKRYRKFIFKEHVELIAKGTELG